MMNRHFAMYSCVIVATWSLASAPLWAEEESTPAKQAETDEKKGTADTTAGVVLVKGQVTDAIGSGIQSVAVTLKAKSTSDVGGDVICETVTDEMGDFTLHGKERLTGTYRVTLSKEKFAAFARELELNAEGNPPFVGETLQGNLSLSGRVVDGRNEQPVAHATVEVSAMYRDWHAETDDDGRFKVSSLPPGLAEITVDASGFARYKQEVASIEEATELQIALQPQRVVRLKIEDESAKPLVGVQVELIAPKQNDLRTAISDEDGRAAFSGISADAEVVFARLTYAGYLSADSFDRSIALSKDDLDSEHALRMVRAASITGVVRDGDGKPVNGARIMVGKDYSLRSARAWSDAEGKFTIDGLSKGRNVLTVHRSEYSPEMAIVETTQGETTTVEIAVKPGRKITGTVKDERGTLMKSMEVVATNWRGFMTLGLRAMTDERGRFEIHDAPEDEFTISAHAPPTSPVSVQVAPGTTDVVVTVPYVTEFDKGVKGAHISVGTPAPPVTLRTTDDELIDVHKLTGKTVLFIFWTSWCASCKAELPNQVKLYERYKNRSDFLMIGINRDEKEADFVKAMKEYKIPWRQVHGHENGATLLAKEFGAFAYPTGYVIGPDGKMAGVYLTGQRIDDLMYDLLVKTQRVRFEPPSKEK